MTVRSCMMIGVASAACSFVASRAKAEVACGSLPNPIVVNGSTAFDPVLTQFAVKLAAESTPTTIVSVAVSSQTTSCGGIQGLLNATDLSGLPGRYYTVGGDGGTAIAINSCTFSAGQTPHLAISDVFYETCANVPQPKPAEIADVLGPVQTTVFIVPRANTVVQYLTYREVQTLFGCGVSNTMKVAGYYSDPTTVFCRDLNSGPRITIARNVGLPESSMKCAFLNSDGRLIYDLTHRPISPGEPVGYDPSPSILGFVSESSLDGHREVANPLAFQAVGQTKAYYPDSSAGVADRRNVRDGHYPLWAYQHLIAKTTADGKLSTQASDLIGWINGTKTSPSVDDVALEGSLGTIPACAMKVKRSSDGGLLSPYTPANPCHCGFEAVITQSIPPGCTPCASASVCPAGKSCRHGFCD